MSKQLTLGSLFDGSGGFPLGGLLCGIKPLWASEVEPFPIRVTTKRLPQVKHYGDICKINGADLPPVNIITFGSPCQSFSVAGKREGMEGKSGLFYEAARVIREMYAATRGEYPTFAVMENVAGIFSSKTNGKSDFLEVLNELIHIKDETLSVPLPEKGRWSAAGEIVGDGFSLGWRTVDAQFWGVAQRRRRCYLVLDLAGERAGKILFDETRLRGNPPQGCFAGQAAAGASAAGAGGAVCVLNDQGGSFMDLSEEITGTLRSQEHGHQPIVFEPGAMLRLGGHCWEGEPTGALRADMGDNQLTVAIPINTQVGLRNHKDGDGTGLGVGEAGDAAYTLQSAHSHAVAIENHPADSRIKIDESGTVQTLTERMGTGGGNVPLVMATGQANAEISEDLCQTLNCSCERPIVMNERQYALTISEDVANTLAGTDYKGTQCLFEPKTLKIRSGCEGGGKGALVQDNMSATLSCNNDQTLFVPKQKTYNVRQASDGTINARCHAYDSEVSRAVDTSGNVPDNGGIAVVDDLAPKAAAFMGGQGADAGSIAYSENIAPTIRGEAGGNSVPMTVYGICSQNSDSMKSGNPNSGIYEMDVSRTLDAVACCGNGGQVVVFDTKQVTSKDNRSNPKHGGPCHTLASASADSAVICLEGNGTRPSHGGSGFSEKNVSFTLNTVETHAICYQNQVGALCASDHKFSQQQQIEEGKAVVERVTVENHQHSGYRESDTAGTLKQCGGTNGGGSESIIVENRYVVRRLTPTECALLQGFPPAWCYGLETPEPAEDDIAFWSEVFETHRKIMGTSKKPKSRSQIAAWLRNPHSDAAEYKMWGNGVCLNNVIFVLGGIAWAAGNSAEAFSPDGDIVQ